MNYVHTYGPITTSRTPCNNRLGRGEVPALQLCLKIQGQAHYPQCLLPPPPSPSKYNMADSLDTISACHLVGFELAHTKGFLSRLLKQPAGMIYIEQAHRYLSLYVGIWLSSLGIWLLAYTTYVQALKRKK